MQKIVRKNLPFHCQHLNLHAILKKKDLEGKKEEWRFHYACTIFLNQLQKF